MTFQKFMEEFLLWSEGVHRPKTVKANSVSLRKFADFVGGGTSLKDIGSRNADLFLAKERKEGKKVNSVNHYYRHLKAAFSKALVWELIEENPFSKIKPLKKNKVPPKFLTQKQINTFLVNIEDPDARYLATAYLATGRRRAELLRLKWSDIDLKGRMYRVNSTKAHLVKDFPINDLFLGVLLDLDQSTDFVFPRWKHPDSVTHVMKNELRKAGFGDMHLHQLRHSFASLYLQKGGDIRSLMDLLGHSQISTTMIYSHLTHSHLAREANKVIF